MLVASQAQLADLQRVGLVSGCDVIDFPLEGQETTDYWVFRNVIAGFPAEDLRFSGIAIMGERKRVSRIAGRLRLFGNDD